MAIVDMTAVPDDEIVVVTNLSDSPVMYQTPSGVQRDFPAKAPFKIKAGELRELSYDAGGRVLLRDYLKVDNVSLAREFGVTDDIVEYNWTDEDITTALTTADINVLLDALDFAPQAIKDRLVNRAVELEISDINRREAITKATGLNITNMINNKKAIMDAEEKTETRKRRVTTNEASTTGRRVQN